jgi:hypothetical protein
MSDNYGVQIERLAAQFEESKRVNKELRASLIVRAVNAHAGLVEAARAAVRRLKMDSDLLWIFGIVIVLVALNAVGIAGDIAEREKFMRECSADHKEYECVSMWRAGASHMTVMPVPVIINH